MTVPPTPPSGSASPLPAAPPPSGQDGPATGPVRPPAGSPAVPPSSPTPAASSGRRSLRWVVVAVVLGVVALLGAGIGTYLGVSNHRSNLPGPADCGRGRCIPTLKAADVRAALEDRGFQCESDSSWMCQLEVGVTDYSVYLTVTGDHISDLYATVFYPEDVTPSATSLSYLVWLAQLPYANDPEFMSDIRNWIEQKVSEGTENARANIGGYGYELNVKQQGLDLSVRSVVVE